jgi:hypothetical protein
MSDSRRKGFPPAPDWVSRELPPGFRFGLGFLFPGWLRRVSGGFEQASPEPNWLFQRTRAANGLWRF